MGTSTVNISFQKDLLKAIDSIARKEARSRSELIREAARAYIERAQSWDNLLKYGKSISRKAKLKESDIHSEIAAYRREKR